MHKYSLKRELCQVSYEVFGPIPIKCTVQEYREKETQTDNWLTQVHLDKEPLNHTCVCVFFKNRYYIIFINNLTR